MHLRIGLFCIFLSTYGFANDEPYIMSLSKLAGACGILDSLITFQTTTNFEQGKEFVFRFWSVEASRLGLESAEDLMQLCLETVPKYDALRNAYEKREEQ